MEDLQYFYGKPIELDNIGIIYPCTMSEYMEDQNLFNVLHIQVNHYLQSISSKEKERKQKVSNTFKNWDIICCNPMYFYQLLILISKIMKVELNLIKTNFDMVYDEFAKGKEVFTDEDIVELGTNIFICIEDKYYISRDNYDYFRNQVIRMNTLRFPRVAKSKAFQEQIDKEYKAKNRNTKEDYGDMMSAIGVELGRLPEELENMTLYQAHLYFGRINKKYKYDADVQFVCAGATDITIESFASHIDLFESDEDMFEKGDINGFTGKMNKLLKK